MQVTTVGLDLTKNIFQVHRVTDDGDGDFQSRTMACAITEVF